jgi:hypothetical protein
MLQLEPTSKLSPELSEESHLPLSHLLVTALSL